MISYIIYSFIYLLIAFVFIMKFKHRVAGTSIEPLTILLVVPFVVCDWLWNLTAGTIVFLDPPAKLFELATGRMKRYKDRYEIGSYNLLERWRYGFAIRLCRFLNQHDKEHC